MCRLELVNSEDDRVFDCSVVPAGPFHSCVGRAPTVGAAGLCVEAVCRCPKAADYGYT
jgi:hypothetical protein